MVYTYRRLKRGSEGRLHGMDNKKKNGNEANNKKPDGKTEFADEINMEATNKGGGKNCAK